MTNKEYLINLLSNLNITENEVNIILLKGALNGDAEVDMTSCDLAIYNHISMIFRALTQNVSEGAYSVTWNMEAVKLFYGALCNELGKENVLIGRPKVRNRSDFW